MEKLLLADICREASPRSLSKYPVSFKGTASAVP